ncbi:glycosyl transferase family 39 [gut metagenome]|uniref:Glycosyl transferase family 39 n=1 Tax=gut metagenome TaxID=749906 RepID=J9FVZ4_9ZZZZ
MLCITGGEKISVIEHQTKLTLQKQPVWTRRELFFLAALTLGTAALSLWQLGDFRAPQNPMDAIGVQKSEQIVLEQPADSLWVYTGVTWDGWAVLTDQSGTELARVDLDTQDAFKWKQVAVTSLEPGSYTLTLSNNQLQEAAFFTADGNLAVASSNGALLDEQLQVPENFSYRNSTYFDEIYHGRTAYEHLHGMPVYETTHPPLGKVFIMLGIAIFGMTGFGWRISGALFGVALVPVLYLFVRRLTRSRFGAGVAAILCALDGMRFAQSRISTIDIYGTFLFC